MLLQELLLLLDGSAANVVASTDGQHFTPHSIELHRIRLGKITIKTALLCPTKEKKRCGSGIERLAELARLLRQPRLASRPRDFARPSSEIVKVGGQ